MVSQFYTNKLIMNPITDVRLEGMTNKLIRFLDIPSKGFPYLWVLTGPANVNTISAWPEIRENGVDSERRRVIYENGINYIFDCHSGRKAITKEEEEERPIMRNWNHCFKMLHYLFFSLIIIMTSIHYQIMSSSPFFINNKALLKKEDDPSILGVYQFMSIYYRAI